MDAIFNSNYSAHLHGVIIAQAGRQHKAVFARGYIHDFPHTYSMHRAADILKLWDRESIKLYELNNTFILKYLWSASSKYFLKS